MSKQENKITNIYYNVHIEGDAVGVVIGSGTINANNIAGGNITQQTIAVSSQFVYAHVPTMPNHFVGRDAQIAQLVAQLSNGQTLALSADGLPGVGKTTMAVALAHHGDILRHFSDGVLWGGLGTNPDPMRILGEWGTALGHDLSHLPTPEQRQRALQNILGNKKVLLVLDDAWQTEPAQLLRCGGPHCAHLLTTRDKGIARTFAGTSQMNNIETLPLADGVVLLQQLAPEACASNPAMAEQLVQAVGGLPLAIELLGGYLADPNAPERLYVPAEMAQAFADLTIAEQRLQLASKRLGSLAGKTSLQATIELSLADLPETTQTAFYYLGAFAPKPAAFSWEAAKAVAEADNRQLATLIERNLLEPDEQRLALHQTLADVAQSHEEVGEASTRHRNFYLALADKDRKDWETIEPAYEQIQWAWQQIPNDEMILDFVWALRIYQGLRGLGHEEIAWIKRALQVAHEQGLHKEERTLFNNIGVTYRDLDQPQKAIDFYNQVLPISQEAGDRTGEAIILTNIGGAYDSLSQPQQALEFYNQALPINREVGDRTGEAITLSNIGVSYEKLGQPQRALDFYNQSLPIRREFNDPSGEAMTLNNIGKAYGDLGQRQQALNLYNQALDIFRKNGDLSGEVLTLTNIGAMHGALGQLQQALSFFNQALTTNSIIGKRSGEANILNNIGVIYEKLGQLQKALDFFNQALLIRREIYDRSGEATTLNNIGSVYHILGQSQQALDFYNQALPISREVSDRWGEVVTRYNIVGILQGQKQLEEAKQEMILVVELAEYVQSPHLERFQNELAQLEAELTAAAGSATG